MNNTQFISFDSGLCARIQPGEAEPMLWIHGYSMDATIWDELWARLPGYRHIGLELPGHGHAGPLTADATLPKLGTAISEVARAYAVRKMIAISFGGMLALQAAMCAPEQFDTIVLGGSAIGNGPQDLVAAKKQMELVYLYMLRGAGPWMTKAWMQWPPDIFKGANAHPGLWKTLEDAINRHQWAELRHRALSTIAAHPQTHDDLRRIQADVLLIQGEYDMPVFTKIAELLQCHLTRCKTETIESAGHLAILESPDRAAALIEHHLQHQRVRGCRPH